MTTKEFLSDICQNAFGNAFQAEIRNMYTRSVAAGNYTEEEAEYSEAVSYFRTVFESEELALLEQYETTCIQIQDFSASYGFRAGLLCGFKQFFTDDNAVDGGFSKYVSQQITMMPNMRTYAANFQNIEHRNTLYSQLCMKSEAVNTYMVSIDCTWSQRAYSASIYGFYCGYHGAMRIIDEVMPLPFGSTTNDRKTIAMEHHLGFSHSRNEHNS